jgi:small subunit ribosomal protein S2
LAASVIRQLIDAGIHFGHRVSRWNPKMQPYILTKRNSIHIIDPKATLKGLLAAKKFLTKLTSGGNDVLFVGTKRQARRAIEEQAREAGMHWVTDRWLGGTLTNFRTIRSRLSRLEKLEQLEADGLLAQQSKKEEARLRREMRKIKRNLEGIRNMERLPGALFAVDAHREVIALREARKLGIPTVALIDTDSDPDLVDIPIPGNDDAMRAIQLIVQEVCRALALGKTQRTDKAEEPAEAAPRRRTRRAVMARADAADDRKPGSEGEGPDEAPGPQAAPAAREAPPSASAPESPPAPDQPQAKTPADSDASEAPQEGEESSSKA